MKTIVAPTDFSPISKNAVNYAANLACAISGHLSLIHVCIVPVAVSEIPAPAFNTLDFMSDAEGMMERLKDDIIRRTGSRLTVYTEVLAGDITTVINQHCKEVHPFAVVMGTESGSAFERFLFGGKTISAINHLPWPVIAVPPE
jgi:nucleotide-binding universal stress UspA family protein